MNMAKRTYGQYCGVARALELVGERWALLIVRDLLVSPKRFTDLRQGLPGIPSNILSARLKELEETGVVERRVLPRPASGVVYALTPYGAELEDVVLRLAAWGAQSLGERSADEVVTADSMVMALRTTFQSAAAGGEPVAFELHVGEIVIFARIANGALETGAGPLPEADLVIEAFGPLRPLLAGELSPAEAIATGQLGVTGDPALLSRFVELFQIRPKPSASPA
jgi:DNA-binding HxlR family transcriptional regulator